jgi:hypothetical protein
MIFFPIFINCGVFALYRAQDPQSIVYRRGGLCERACFFYYRTSATLCVGNPLAYAHRRMIVLSDDVRFLLFRCSDPTAHRL